ncbi:Nin one binding Zn-ribbon like-domain-containing protein [Melampsora americana]|nr:Nin one binding Zn-ribbon like-domain-containing protein [Melampsora americana]
MPSQDRTQTLVLDTAPLLTSTLSSLLVFSHKFVTTPDVMEEVRGKGQRDRLQREWNMLDAALSNPTGDENQENKKWQGLEIREPSVAGISKVKEFARQTGDIAVLSTADIRVLALAYDVEVEANGTWRLRDKVGGKRLGKDPVKKAARLLRKQARIAQESESIQPTDQVTSSDVDALAGRTKQLDINHYTPNDNSSIDHEIDTSDAKDQSNESHSEVDVDHPDEQQSSIPATEDNTTDGWTHIPVRSSANVIDECEGDDSDASSDVSESDPSWITPDNVHLHKAKDMGFFPALASKASQLGDSDHGLANAEVKETATPTPRPDVSTTNGSSQTTTPTMKAALLTGDFAMQNVALQIGLNVFGVGGKRIRDVKTFVLRCYGCFKLCKDPTRKFCPTCGGATLTRVSITYTPSSPNGYILHLKANFQYRNRGTVYNIPSAKPGSSSFDKGGKSKGNVVNGATLVLREDQKEYQRGLKSLEIQKSKEERKLNQARQERSGKQDGFVFGGANGWNDPDWEAPMLMGERGRKGGRAGNRDVQYGKDGLPVIGFGKNPNVVRRRC